MMDMDRLSKFGQRAEPEARRVSGISNPQDWLIDIFGGSESSSGARVNSYTALETGAVWQCLKIVSNDMSSMPIDVVDNMKDVDRKDRIHQAHKLMNQDAHPEIDHVAFRHTMQMWALLHGNAIAAIERNSLGQAMSLTPLEPGSTYIERDDSTGELWYMHTTRTGHVVPMLQHEVFHIAGMGDALWGYSVLDVMRNTIGSAIAGQEYRAHQWRHNARPTVVIKKKGKWDEEGVKGFARQWKVEHEGFKNAGKVAMLPEAYDIETVAGITNEQQQLVEQLDKDVLAISRYFNVPGYRLGININSNRANLQQQQLDYLQSTLQEHIDRWQSEIRRKLISARDQRNQKYSIRFNSKALLRTDTDSRFKAYQLAIQMGIMTINEVRALEDWDKIEGGDFLGFPLNFRTWGPTPLDDPEPEPAQTTEEDPVHDMEDDTEEDPVIEEGVDSLQQFKLYAESQLLLMQESERKNLQRISRKPIPDRQQAYKTYYAGHALRCYERLEPLCNIDGFVGTDKLQSMISEYVKGALANAIAETEKQYELERTGLVKCLISN